MLETKKSLTFFVNIDKQTDEFILQEGTLLSLKIPKRWQKPHASAKSPALWVCHLPANSLGIVYISLYPTELVIKKRNPEKDSESFENYEKKLDLGNLDYESTQKEENFLTYKGTLEPNGETEKERFYRCRLKLQKKKEEEPKVESEGGGAAIAIFLIILFVILIAVGMSRGFN